MITPIAEEHIESFHRALDRVARERRYLAFLEAPPLESTRAFVLENIAQHHPQFVALDGGQVVGWCDIRRSVRPTAAHAGVLGIALVPEFRGRGLGAALLAQTLAAAERQGLTRVELTVRADNKRAIALYERFGFGLEGRLRNAGRVDGQYHDVIVMAKLFSA